MRVLREGHKYELMCFDPPIEIGDIQTIQFIEKVPSGPIIGHLKTLNNGTTNEEVLEMLINRMNYLQEKFPCRENALVITKLEESLMWLNERTRKRNKQNVEGKNLNHK